MNENDLKLPIYIFKYPRLLLSLLILAFVTYYYSPILFHPNSYLLNDKGDAIKNYYCYEWHVQHDKSDLQFSGSNYPYGELHAYTDGNPFISNFVRLFSFLKPYSIAILNLSMLASFFICALVLYAILRFYSVSALLAIIGSLGITVLCPQSLRLGGHLALSYNFAIPLIIYLLAVRPIKWFAFSNTWAVLFSTTAVFFIHPYLGMICSLMALFFYAIQFAIKFNKGNFLELIIGGISPILLYFLFIKINDHHTGRPENPFGFLYFTANIETVFISVFPPFRHFLSQIYKIRGQNWEGIAYVGITTLIAFIFMLYYGVKNFNGLSLQIRKNQKAKEFIALIIISLLLLFFSMGLPFKWGMEDLLDHFPLVKQFRAPGRFAWAFYFIATILSTIIISRFFFTKLKPALKTILCSAILLLFLADGFPYHHSMKNYMHVKNQFAVENLNGELKFLLSKINPESQAILPLPFFHYGSDFFSFEGTEKIKTGSMMLSYHSKMPLIADNTPRVSLSESINLTNIFSNNLIQKNILADLPDSSPITVIYSKEQLLPEEERLLKKCKITAETNGFLLAELDPKELAKNNMTNLIQEFEKSKNSLIHDSKIFKSDSSFSKLFDFDSLPEGVYQGIVNRSNLVTKFNSDLLAHNEAYEVSCIYSGHKEELMNNYLKLKVSTPNSDSLITLASRNINTMPDFINGFVIARLQFIAPNPPAIIHVVFEGSKKSKATVFRADNLLIKSVKSSVYWENSPVNSSKKTLFYNNFPLN